MATSFGLGFIALGAPTASAPSVTLLGIGQQGTVGAKRILTHPDSANFAPITYWGNPDYTYNLDNDVLTAPISSTQLTIGSTQTIRFARNTDDVVVEEFWEGSVQKAAMPTSQFRAFYEYLINPPALATPQDYITWQPRDRNSNTYNVELFAMSVGGGDGDRTFKMREFRLNASGASDIRHALDFIDATPDGLIQEVTSLRMRIVSVV